MAIVMSKTLGMTISNNSVPHIDAEYCFLTNDTTYRSVDLVYHLFHGINEEKWVGQCIYM